MFEYFMLGISILALVYVVGRWIYLKGYHDGSNMSVDTILDSVDGMKDHSEEQMDASDYESSTYYLYRGAYVALRSLRSTLSDASNVLKGNSED